MPDDDNFADQYLDDDQPAPPQANGRSREGRSKKSRSNKDHSDLSRDGVPRKRSKRQPSGQDYQE